MASHMPFGVEIGTNRDLPPLGGAAHVAEIARLNADLERVSSERNRLAEVQRRVMDLLGTQSPDKLVHDLRNVLNERALFKALFDSQPE